MHRYKGCLCLKRFHRKMLEGTRHEKKKRKTEAYTKGFAPLPKQKYAKNVDEYGRTADEAYEDPYDYDRPVDAAYDESYEYDRPVDPAYEEPYDDVEREPRRRPSHRGSREEYEEPREYEDRGYEPVYYREQGGPPNYGDRDYAKDDYGPYGSESSADRRRRRKRGGKKHKAKLLERERAYGPPERRSRY
ncbi:hypothetical protein ANCCAN_17999 [Ancylostoma caninum]|uniref:Uncharacterized protein n=1 Tax=Ancylostoma caninum TaxID=29170 RepID=A0A368FVC4_ANCCA|nr:hypothetical protein ANCCAN_17999 [Ancylostoma caninum]